jgi:hypothetical protein
MKVGFPSPSLIFPNFNYLALLELVHPDNTNKVSIPQLLPNLISVKRESPTIRNFDSYSSYKLCSFLSKSKDKVFGFPIVKGVLPDDTSIDLTIEPPPGINLFS